MPQYPEIESRLSLCTTLASTLPNLITLPLVVSANGEVLVKPFKFTNDNDGFCKLLSTLVSYERGSLIIGLESTAYYADNLVEFLVSKRCQVCVLNPIQTSTIRKNNIRKAKTDKVDTLVIARTLITQLHRFFSQEETLTSYT